MKYYLATTGISEIWDLQKKLLVLGPWCLTDKKNKELLINKDYISVISPWRPAFKIKEAEDYCFNIYKELLEELSDNLNRIHDVYFSVKYWRILLGYWLLQFIGIVYDRYKRIENTHKLFPDFYTHVLPRERYDLSCFDVYDFSQNKINNDYYSLMLFSIILNELYPENTLEKDLSMDIQCGLYNYSWKRKIFHKTITFFDIFLKNPVVFSEMYHFSPKDMLLLKFKAGFNALSFLDFSPKWPPSEDRKISIDIRKKIILRKKNDQFHALISTIIPNAMPICYLENFNFYRNSILHLKPRKLIGSSTGWYMNERFKFFAAEAASVGAKFFDFQLGGGYGVSLSIPGERFAFSNDSFYTWGWALKNVNTLKPLPSAHLSKINNSYNYKLDNLLMVGTSIPKYVYILHSNLLPDDMDKYFNDKTLFLKALPEAIKDKILYRPSYSDLGWGEIDIVRETCPSVKFIHKGTLCNWMKKVRLAVIDHPHTSYLEALSINVPCVFYWDPEVYLTRPEAEPYFELLRKAGIIYGDPKSAAEKVSEIYYNSFQWWSSPEVQNARLIFCEKYAYARKHWLKIWVEELNHIRSA